MNTLLYATNARQVDLHMTPNIFYVEARGSAMQNIVSHFYRHKGVSHWTKAFRLAELSLVLSFFRTPEKWEALVEAQSYRKLFKNKDKNAVRCSGVAHQICVFRIVFAIFEIRLYWKVALLMMVKQGNMLESLECKCYLNWKHFTFISRTMNTLAKRNSKVLLIWEANRKSFESINEMYKNRKLVWYSTMPVCIKPHLHFMCHTTHMPYQSLVVFNKTFFFRFVCYNGWLNLEIYEHEWRCEKRILFLKINFFFRINFIHLCY